MTAQDALRALRERWWILVVAAVLAAGAAFAYTQLPWVEPRWRSSVVIQATGRLDYGNFLALEKELRPLAEQVRQLSVMREVDRTLRTDLPPQLMLGRTKAEPVQDSGQIRIDYEDPDPIRAEQIALAIADVYTLEHNAAEQGKLREERVILSLLDRDPQAIQTWPLTATLVPAAAVLGLLVAAGVLLGLAYLDTTLRTSRDIERHLDLPVLGAIPRPRTRAMRDAVGAPRPSPERARLPETVATEH